jgi:hypothetical protein
MPRRPTKFGNEITERGFHSLKEQRYYDELVLRERVGEIRDIKWQVSFELIPKQEGEKPCSYVADFTYLDNKTGNTVVVDVKGYRTEVYRVKRKLLLHVHGIRILEA